MMLMEQLGQHLTPCGLATDLLDPDRLQLLEPLDDGLLRESVGCLWRQAHSVWTTPPSDWQLDQAALLEFEEQTPSSHILEQPRCIAPLPLQG